MAQYITGEAWLLTNATSLLTKEQFHSTLFFSGFEEELIVSFTMLAQI